jgi:mediator of RNA polymerase II transcription subunit 8
MECKEDDTEELWNWAADWIGQRAAKYVLEEGGENYTFEERESGIENVRTGLRRGLDGDESDEEEDDDEDEEIEDVGLNATNSETINSSKVEPGAGEIKGKPAGTRRTVDEILRASTAGVVGNRQ